MKTGILLLFMIISVLSCAQNDGINQLSSIEASGMLNQDDKLIVLDVRTPAEFKAGHIKNAINIDITNADAFSNINALDPEATYIVLCRTNNRSRIATDYMKQNGFKNIYQLSDGYVGWNKNGLPEESYNQ